MAVTLGAGAGSAAPGAPAKAELVRWRDRIEAHLKTGILDFWLRHGPDPVRGGFHGALDREGKPDPASPRSLVQQSRILWTFAAARRMFPDERYRQAADRQFAYLSEKFLDPRWGGWYWSVSASGQPLDTHKHLYGQSFIVYALAEYALLTGDPKPFRMAVGTFNRFDGVAHDTSFRGYREAWTQEWQPETAEYPIGPPAQKSANTHLHLLESLSALVRAGGTKNIRERLEELRAVCLEKLPNPAGWTYESFRPDWTPVGAECSYGHDVELAWLLRDATVTLGQPAHERVTHRIAVALIDHTLTFGYDAIRGGIFERGPQAGPATNRGKTWWAQAEALVGFLDAYRWTGNPKYWKAFETTAEFVLREVHDREFGEWYPQFDDAGKVTQTWKASPWKGPYHQGRACLEVLKHLDALIARAP